jgi:hypothetical protein
MAISETSICNDALLRVGAKPITSINDENERATLCFHLYAETRDQILDSFQWSFAQRRTTLTKLIATPAFGYSFYYQLPGDTLRVNEFSADDFPLQNYKWQVEHQGEDPESSIVIATNAPSGVSVRYTARITDTSKFSFRFAGILKLRLASKLAYPIKKDGSLARSLYDEYQIEMERAKTSEQYEGTPKDFFTNVELDDFQNEINPLIDVRF